MERLSRRTQEGYTCTRHTLPAYHIFRDPVCLNSNWETLAVDGPPLGPVEHGQPDRCHFNPYPLKTTHQLQNSKNSMNWLDSLSTRLQELSRGYMSYHRVPRFLLTISMETLCVRPLIGKDPTKLQELSFGYLSYHGEFQDPSSYSPYLWRPCV